MANRNSNMEFELSQATDVLWCIDGVSQELRYRALNLKLWIQKPPHPSSPSLMPFVAALSTSIL